MRLAIAIGSAVLLGLIWKGMTMYMEKDHASSRASDNNTANAIAALSQQLASMQAALAQATNSRPAGIPPGMPTTWNSVNGGSNSGVMLVNSVINNGTRYATSDTSVADVNQMVSGLTGRPPGCTNAVDITVSPADINDPARKPKFVSKARFGVGDYVTITAPPGGWGVSYWVSTPSTVANFHDASVATFVEGRTSNQGDIASKAILYLKAGVTQPCDLEVTFTRPQ